MSSFIEIKDACEHNLKKVSLKIPHHQLTVVTGLSGSGKTSLAFDTLYAEGQRRYIETFSPYTRQFLDRISKPDVHSIHNIPPAIAIEQANSIKSPRSTVGTITEITDYLKLLFPRISHIHCPRCEREVKPHSTEEIKNAALKHFKDEEVLIVFPVFFPKRTKIAEAFRFLSSQGFLRVLHKGEIIRTDEDPTKGSPITKLHVIQDRILFSKQNASRMAEAIESSLKLGKGLVHFLVNRKENYSTQKSWLSFSSRWCCRYDLMEFKEPSPSLFSFNSPIGACPQCKGFGRTIKIDYDLVVPDGRLTIIAGAIRPFQGAASIDRERELIDACKRKNISIYTPFQKLRKKEQDFILFGEAPKKGLSSKQLAAKGLWYGVQGFFDWLETQTYKMPVRVFLSRYRGYDTCSACKGTRFSSDTLLFKHISSLPSLPEPLSIGDIGDLPLDQLHEFFSTLSIPEEDAPSLRLQEELLSRCKYLLEVGLSYLNLNRPTRTLSGGELMRVNLTSSLGNSLVNTLFVLDEPTIGLHPRDNARLISTIQKLRNRGNTVIVVEHDEDVMEKADHIIDIGPGRGKNGGEVVYEGNFEGILQSKKSLTGKYLSGKLKIPFPKKRRPPSSDFQVEMKGVSIHNIRDLDVKIPLGICVAITGVSGSGKSSLLHDAFFQNIERQIRDPLLPLLHTKEILGGQQIRQIIRSDQSPLTKTSRSNPALYLGAYDKIRTLFASSEYAQMHGLGPSSFSFNTDSGRCPRCKGMGKENVEMQFLANISVLCPVCEGKRFMPHVLNATYRGKDITEVLELTVAQANEFFSPPSKESSVANEENLCKQIREALSWLSKLGLDYLLLGQPLCDLSGGEAQRIKLISYLSECSDKTTPPKKRKPSKKQLSHEEQLALTEAEAAPPPPSRTTRLFIFDEPTTGLHTEDIRLLLQTVQTLVDQGDSVLLIEHNLDVIQSADWVIDMGPEGGDAGGKIIAQGTPEEIFSVRESHTARYLKKKFSTSSAAKKKIKKLPKPKSYPPSKIQIRGARHHNLKSLNLDIELGKITTLTGLSGSGKSSLAFDILFSEGQRRYLDCLNVYARQFIEQLEKPDVDSLVGIPPTVAIAQQHIRGGSKSTVGTVTEIYQFMRLLYSKLGTPHDPKTGEMAVEQSVKEILKCLKKHITQEGDLSLLSPIVRGRKGFHSEIGKWALRKKYPYLRIDGEWVKPKDFKALERHSEHSIEVVLGNISKKDTPKVMEEKIRKALNIGQGTFFTLNNLKEEILYSQNLFCPQSGLSFDKLDPRLFSFNSSHGWCPTCKGHRYIDPSQKTDNSSLIEEEIEAERNHESDNPNELILCPTCEGERLNEIARNVKLIFSSSFKKKYYPRLPELCSLPISEISEYLSSLRLQKYESLIASDIIPEISHRIDFLKRIGLGYLQLNRPIKTLSSGETQRIHLTAQLGSNLQGVLYVLDEPTIGLHSRDNHKLLSILKDLKEKKNTLVIVEHDEDTMKISDRIIDLGPGAGKNGGEIIADGTWKELSRDKNSLTGQILGTPLQHPIRGKRRPFNPSVPSIHIEGAFAHNLKDINFQIPLGQLTVLCGVSGSGKSTLMFDVLKAASSLHTLARRSKKPRQQWKSIQGTETIEKVYEIDQSPIGRSSRSTPATYIGIMDTLRKLFAKTPLARQRGFGANRFSYNSRLGCCPDCKGHGVIKVEMNFLPPSFVTCTSCHGNRFNPETLSITYREKNFAQILSMSGKEAAPFFKNVPDVNYPLKLMCDIGLGYVTLGQASPTLSGGEAQRMKLVAELSSSLISAKNQTLRSRSLKPPHHLYLLEEPTIGLHLADVKRLLEIVHQLLDVGNTVVIIEHHLNVIAEADFLIELGPEGGEAGGEIIGQGTPEQLVKIENSPTGAELKKKLNF